MAVTSRVRGGRRLRGTFPFVVRPQHVEAITGTGAFAAAKASFAGAGGPSAPGQGGPKVTPKARFQLDKFVIEEPQPFMVEGRGALLMAAAALSGAMDVGPDPNIALIQRDDADLLTLLRSLTFA